MKISHKIFGGFFAILLFFSLMLYYFIFPNFFRQTDGYVKENIEAVSKNISKEINERENIKVNLGGFFKVNCQLFINDKKVEAKKVK